MQVRAANAIRRAGLYLLAAALAQGCASKDEISCAITDINKEFQQQYEQILQEKGLRAFNVRPAAAFTGTRSALFHLGMRLEAQDPDLGLLDQVRLGRLRWRGGRCEWGDCDQGG